MGGPSWGTISTFWAVGNRSKGQTKHNDRNFSIDDAVRCHRIRQIALFLDCSALIGQTCAIGAFEEFDEFSNRIHLSALPVGDLGFQIKALREERLFRASNKSFSIKRSMKASVSRAMRILSLSQPQLQGGNSFFPLPGSVVFHAVEFLFEITPFVGTELNAGKLAADCGFHCIFPHAGGRADLGVAAVVSNPLLHFSDQGILAALTGEAAAIQEIVFLDGGVDLSRHYGLHVFKHRPRHQRLMDPGEVLAGLLDPDEARVERVVQQL